MDHRFLKCNLVTDVHTKSVVYLNLVAGREEICVWLNYSCRSERTLKRVLKKAQVAGVDLDPCQLGLFEALFEAPRYPQKGASK